MKSIKIVFIGILVAVIFYSCGKEGGCFSRDGKQISENKLLAPFDTVVANDAFEIVLKQSQQYSIEMIAGENLIPNIGATVENNSLILSNNNRCDWMKPKTSKIKLIISAPQFRRVKLTNSCFLRSEDTLRGEDFGLVLMDKVQDVDLTLKVNTFYYWNNPPCGGKVMLRGYCQEIKIWNWALISIDTREMECQKALVYSNSIGDIHVRPSDFLDCTILHRGNVYYYGTPSFIDLKDEGEGELLKGD